MVLRFGFGYRYEGFRPLRNRNHLTDSLPSGRCLRLGTTHLPLQLSWSLLFCGPGLRIEVVESRPPREQSAPSHHVSRLTLTQRLEQYLEPE